jgi:hypothetical protein
MNSDTGQLLGTWREEILAEGEAMRSELAETRDALAAAEIADRAEKARQRTLHARIGAGPLANALALRLEATTKDVTSGLVARLRGEVAELERRVADCHDALEQIDRALAPPDDVGTEDSRAAA